MIESLLSVVGQRGVDALAFLLAFALTALMDSVFHDKLPHDHGREFAVNGALSKGKARGSGLIFVLCIALVSLAFLPFKVEYVIYTILLIASMLSGYFDDAAETAWNEYKKGIIDFAIAIVAGVTYLNFNGCGVNFLQWSFTLPYAVYLLLIVILIWTSINVVNCTDGVDGLSASVAVVTIGTYLLAYKTELAEYGTAGVVFMGALLAYLWSNAKPSSLLMGDAGSRAMGFFIAMLSLKCGHPFAFLLAAIVFIVDGSLGILKISLKRFLHISILKNTRTPLHDHARKNKGWSDEQVVARWLIMQCVAAHCPRLKYSNQKDAWSCLNMFSRQGSIQQCIKRLLFYSSIIRYSPAFFAAACTTWPTSTEVVTVPTPPGTGVMASTTGSASLNFTSPHSLPFSFT